MTENLLHDAVGDPDPDSRATHKASLSSRLLHGVTSLMEERTDLRGVLPYADFVDDGVRWSA